jgi:hypothetical protein
MVAAIVVSGRNPDGVETILGRRGLDHFLEPVTLSHARAFHCVHLETSRLLHHMSQIIF